MFSGSSLVDLKAEISRKETELYETKDIKRSFGGNAIKLEEITGKKRKKKKHTHHTDKPENSHVQSNEIGDETLQLLEKARHKLEAKAKIYEKMRTGEMEDVENIHGETKFLVDFQHKYYTEVDDADRWLNKTTVTDTQASSSSSSSLFEANELHREKMRAKWEKEQEELLDGPVHYENVKCDEIRDLGTGYFAFSKDEEERKKQFEELDNIREHTNTAQNKKELLHKKRKIALQHRLDKVKIRKLGNSETELINSSNDQVEILNCESGEELVSSDKISDSNKPCEINSAIKLSEMESIENDALPLEDEEVLKLCRKDSQKEREWDKGKNCGFMKQIFIKSKEPCLYEKIIEERKEERVEDFAPPHAY